MFNQYRVIKKKDFKGRGICGNPTCKAPRAKGRYLCEAHAADMDRISKEMEEDPWLLYNQRSDSPHRKNTKAIASKPKRQSICKYPGCYELIDSYSDFCFEHEDYYINDEDEF